MFKLLAADVALKQCEVLLQLSEIACPGAGAESLRRFMDAEASRPSSWFFPLYNFGPNTPIDKAMVCTLVDLVHSSTTPAFFISGGCEHWVDTPQCDDVPLDGTRQSKR
jgi:hypothetical protein